MRIKQTFLIITLIFSLCGSFLIVGSAYAAVGDPCGDKTLKAGESCCGGTVTSVISCDQNNKGNDIKHNGVWGLLMIVVNILTGAVTIAALGGIAYAAIMYASAGGSVDQTKKAIGIIMNVVTGAVLYAVTWALLNWLIPGGAF